jgi:phosphatidylserine decarboxylase
MGQPKTDGFETYNQGIMVKDGYYYGLGFVAVAAVVWFTTHVTLLLVPPLVLAVFFLWFFRDPERTIPQGAGLIVSPADGLVTEAEWVETTGGSRLRVSIFLNVFDVHVNRVPISGTVTVVDYRQGGFMNAMNPESVLANEQTMIVIAGDGYEVAFKQIAGLLARRIVCNLKTGDKVERGQRMGMIKFGSRCDVLMPAEADLRVKVGSRVKGGTSVLGALSDGTSDAATSSDTDGQD